MWKRWHGDWFRVYIWSIPLKPFQLARFIFAVVQPLAQQVHISSGYQHLTDISAHPLAQRTRFRFGEVVATCFVCCTLLFFVPALHDRPLVSLSALSPALITCTQPPVGISSHRTGFEGKYCCQCAACPPPMLLLASGVFRR